MNNEPAKCPYCGKAVRLDRAFFAGWHLCVTQQEMAQMEAVRRAYAKQTIIEPFPTVMPPAQRQDDRTDENSAKDGA